MSRELVVLAVKICSLQLLGLRLGVHVAFDLDLGALSDQIRDRAQLLRVEAQHQAIVGSFERHPQARAPREDVPVRNSAGRLHEGAAGAARLARSRDGRVRDRAVGERLHGRAVVRVARGDRLLRERDDRVDHFAAAAVDHRDRAQIANDDRLKVGVRRARRRLAAATARPAGGRMSDAGKVAGMRGGVDGVAAAGGDGGAGCALTTFGGGGASAMTAGSGVGAATGAAISGAGTLAGAAIVITCTGVAVGRRRATHASRPITASSIAANPPATARCDRLSTSVVVGVGPAGGVADAAGRAPIVCRA